MDEQDPTIENEIPPSTKRARWENLFKSVHPALILLIGLAILWGLWSLQQWLQRLTDRQALFISGLDKQVEQLTMTHDHYLSLENLKAADVARFKAGFSNTARSNKSLFESGLSLQEERRLLDKQLEIMTTYLVVNPALQRVFIMRGDQPLQSYLIDYIPLRSFPTLTSSPADVSGGSSTLTSLDSGLQSAGMTAKLKLPSVVRIVSKERFAHPERGKSEVVNGQLQYTPPQVDTSVRSNALGEYVMYTNNRLIIHGPPLNTDDHEKFSHICLGLDLDAARKLYNSSFIGTKIYLTNVSVTQ